MLGTSLNAGPFASGVFKFFLWQESLPKTEDSCLFPIPLSMTLSLAKDPSCQAFLPSKSWLLGPISQHQSNQLRISSPGWQLKSFNIFCSSLRDRDQMVSVSFMISVSSFSYSCDCSSVEQATFADYLSCSILIEASSFLTKSFDFHFYCVFLFIGVTDTVSSLTVLSVGVFSLSPSWGCCGCCKILSHVS